MEQQARSEPRTTSEGSCGSEVTLQLVPALQWPQWEHGAEPLILSVRQWQWDHWTMLWAGCATAPVRFALESRVSKNTLGITPYHVPSGATVLSIHIKMSRHFPFLQKGQTLLLL